MSDMIQNFIYKKISIYIYKKISIYNRLEIKFNKSTSKKKKNASQYTRKSNFFITLNL